MKHLKRVLCGFVAVGCLLSCLVGCTADETQKEQLEPYVAEDEYGKVLKEKDEFTEVARSGGLALYVKGTTAEILVEDVKTGKRWYSNPQDRGTDSTAQTKQLGSQLDVWVYDENRILNNKNTVSDAIEYGQVSYAQIENGIRVTYVLGKMPTIFVIPTAITVERFQQLLENMGEESRKYVSSRYQYTDINEIESDSLRENKLEQYPVLEQRPLYIINDNLADFVKEKLESCFQNAGYTLEALEQDNWENGVPQVELPLIITVPLEYKLEDRSLVVCVNTKSIDVPEDAHLSSLSLLRYFGAAGTDAQGYMLLADGSGSLIQMNNGKSHLATLKVPVYGEDLTKSFDQKPASEQVVSLPVYGIAQGDQAFLAVIESGDAVASVEAGVAGQINNYNFIYSSYEITQQVKVPSSYDGDTEMLLFQKGSFDKPLQLRYFFLTENNANYVGMARCYRDYLMENGTLQQAPDLSPAMHLELLGATTYTDTFLGIAMDKEQTLTTFAQAQTIVNALHEAGVGKISTTYRYWANGGSDTGLMDTLNPESGLGGTDGLAQLQNSLTATGDRLYVTADLQYVINDKLFDGYMSLFDAPKNILNERTGKKLYSSVTLEPEGYLDTLTPGMYPDMAKSILESMQELGLNGVDPLMLGQELYSDFDRNSPIDRQDARQLVQKALSAWAAKQYLVRCPNVYALVGADEIMQLPTQSNEYYLCDASVPFYQIVLHGVIPYSSEAVNHSGNVRECILQAAETGSSLMFSLMYEPNDVLYKTDLQTNANHYSVWLETAADGWAQLSELLEQVSDSYICDHQILSDTLRKTVYENGTCVYVNYGYESITIEGVTVPARSFAVTEVGQ